MNSKPLISKDAHNDAGGIVRLEHELKNPQAAAGFFDDVEASRRRCAADPRLYSQNLSKFSYVGYTGTRKD
ncbi:MAG: hypothetical protein LBT43_03365, partial [Prevotella sp.]|nr:hypothetical protein [Prevotella sp.]